MPDARHAIIHITTGTPTTGGWCEQCNLPSLIEVPANIIGTSGVRTIGTYTVCTEHGTGPTTDHPPDQRA